MTLPEFIAAGEEIKGKFPAVAPQHGYFRQHAARLCQACNRFELFAGNLGDVLEIGPFYGYTPFILRPACSSYTVLEGDDPAVHALEDLYRQHDIRFSYIDFFDLFGPTRTATHALAIPDASFDRILCWETMEHFNFNPVKFVRELHRVLRPGGRAFITVPNKAAFQAIAALLTGRGERQAIENFFKYENYESNGKKAYYGFHWREYSSPELAQLFAGTGFNVERCGTLVAFQDHGRTGLMRKLARAAARVAAAVFGRFGTHVYLVARK